MDLMGISETKMKIVIDNYFKSECNVDTSIRQAFEKGFRIGVQKGITLQSEWKKDKWIPCSEKLPENDESVLATTAWGDVTMAERVYPPINDTCWFIHDGNTNATIDDVVAWRHLPEPYRGKQD